MDGYHRFQNIDRYHRYHRYHRYLMDKVSNCPFLHPELGGRV